MTLKAFRFLFLVFGFPDRWIRKPVADVKYWDELGYPNTKELLFSSGRSLQISPMIVIQGAFPWVCLQALMPWISHWLCLQQQ